MTEQEWLSSDEPAAMLRALQDGSLVAGDGLLLAPPYRNWPSERKLRLFACACMRLSGISQERCDAVEQEGPPRLGDGEKRHTDTEFAYAWTGRGSGRPTAAQKAALLREIVGNPFRPWCVAERRYGATLSGYQVLDLDALTPAALSLATVAYDERQPDGSLDPLTLLATADALEEAGCAGDRCKACHGSGTYTVQATNAGVSAANGYGAATTYSEWRGCRSCGGDYDRKGSGRLPNPLLTHLRSPGPHVRGCWALDLILGKS